MNEQATVMENRTEPLFENSGRAVESRRVLYTPAPFAKEFLLHLQEVGRLQALSVHKSSRKALSSYLFFVVLSGEGQLTYEGENYYLREGDCVFIDCKKAYSHATSEKLWQLCWCHFEGPQMLAIYDKYLERGGRPAFHSQVTRYAPLLEELLQIAESAHHVRDMQINTVLSSLLALLMEDAWNPLGDAVTGKQREIRNVRAYLETHFREHITLDDLSGQFYIDKFYLCEQFKEQYGVTVNDYLINIRITEAKKLLRFTNLSMEEIAEQTGINSGAYFSRLFKKVEGCSPSEFKRMW